MVEEAVEPGELWVVFAGGDYERWSCRRRDMYYRQLASAEPRVTSLSHVVLPKVGADALSANLPSRHRIEVRGTDDGTQATRTPLHHLKQRPSPHIPHEHR
jgi:hypothetical protein